MSAREIAKGLSAEQRDTIRSIKGLFNWHTFISLPNGGIARKNHEASAWQLTPLGHEVRAILMEQANADK